MRSSVSMVIRLPSRRRATSLPSFTARRPKVDSAMSDRRQKSAIRLRISSFFMGEAVGTMVGSGGSSCCPIMICPTKEMRLKKPDGHMSTFPRHDPPGLCFDHHLRNQEGAGSTGCSVAPAARMQKKTPQVRRNTGTPCAMAYSLYVVSPVSGLVSHRPPGLSACRAEGRHRHPGG